MAEKAARRALVTGFLGLMVQAALASRHQIARLDARVRTLVELREAGAFGTGGFGGDKPVGEHDFTVGTLERVLRIPHAAHLARVDEYVFRLVPHPVLGVILFFAGSELAASVNDDTYSRADRIVLVVTAGVALWSMGGAYVTGLLLYHANRRRMIRLD